MSHSAVLQIFFNKTTTIEEIITILLDTGWLLNDYGKISLYVELEDGEHDWIDMELVERKDFFEALKARTKDRKLAGIVLSWKYMEEGISLLLQNPKLLTISMLINRRTLENSIFSNTNWYLDRILVPLAQNIQVESFMWNEHV